MALMDTIKEIRHTLACLTIDIEKAAGGNKAASQRVRTGTIKLEKVAKKYRKESIVAEKSGTMKKLAAAKKATKPKPKAKAKPAPAHVAKAKPAQKVKPKAGKKR
jgi:hypothetical protein